MSGNNNGDGDRKLESWKEIAAFFERDLRTVIRWEKELALPVHRYPGKAKGRVYAFASELQAWADGPRKAAAEATTSGGTQAAVLDPPPPDSDPDATVDSSIEESALRTRTADRRRRWIAAAVSVFVILVLVGAAVLRFYRPQPISSVAVLPFDNPGQESDPAFVEGLTDEITASLSRLDGLRVAGRSSTYALKGSGGNLRELGTRLKVEAVVEGSVQRSGNHTRVTVQLNRTQDGFT